MNRFTNLFMLGIWIFQLIFGVIAICGKVTIPPVLFICAAMICIMHYLEELID